MNKEQKEKIKKELLENLEMTSASIVRQKQELDDEYKRKLSELEAEEYAASLRYESLKKY